MKRIGKCLNFELKYIGKSTLAFLGFYIMIYAILVTLFVVSNLQGNSNSSMSGSFYIAMFIFIFVFITSTYKTLFNYLMIFGNTRKSIVFSSFISYTVLSAAMALLAALFMALEKMLSGVINGVGEVDMISIMYPGGVNIGTELLWFTALFILISAFAMLYGSLTYKFGSVFLWAFWVLFAFSLYAGMDNIIRSLKNFFCVGSPDGILLAPVYFIITAAVLGACAYLAARRQPQNA